MEKKLQVFISSTYLDLKEERQKAVEAVLRARHIPAGMELFTAASKSQWAVIEGWIKESDTLMLIFGGKYGSVEPDSGKSYTQLEYEFALKHNIPVFAIILDDKFLARKKYENHEQKIYESEVDKPQTEKYQEFRELVSENLYKSVTNIDQISTEVTLVLKELIDRDETEYNFKGWVRAQQIEKENNVYTISPKLLEKDESLLEKVIFKIESGSFIENIEIIDNYCAYQSEVRQDIEDFIIFSEIPSSRFYTEGLQELFEELIEQLKTYNLFLVTHFFTRRGVGSRDGRKYLYPDLNIDLSNASLEAMERYDGYLSKLNALSRKTISCIREFVHQSGFKLYQ
ncbi:DUF4062 domain-containing protein [Paenibacillus sp. Y5S-9]|uniref:DUF4062 domain-containing protein n=1 Tax=Paenibacillus sp. Y5S-9 TaxID=3122489 RepID=UPI0030D28D99